MVTLSCVQDLGQFPTAFVFLHILTVYLNSVEGCAHGQIIDMLESVYGHANAGSIIITITAATYHRITTLDTLLLTFSCNFPLSTKL